MQHPNARGPGAPGAKIDFNALKAPANYRPGLGRGASGFTTRSDIGPSMPAPDVPKEADEEGKFDAFLGNDSGVLAGSGVYDEEDREADQIWEQVDQRMEERRKTQREAKEAEALEKFRERNPKISEQFQDLKRKLTSVSESEWDAIPDIGDTTIRKPKRAAIFTPAPDSLLARAAGGGLGSTVVEPEGGASVVPGTATDLTAVGQGRSTVVQLNLDRVSDSVSGQTVVDPKGYLTDMKSMVLKSDAEVSDIKKARLLLKSVTSTNPRHAPGWIAAARLEEVAGRLPAARALALRGCELCQDKEGAWLEAARLHPRETAKAILARGAAALPASVPIWLAAAELEAEPAARKRVLLRALDRVPQSVRLWKAAVELSDEAEARVLLSRAVELCPQHVELWLALAKLESHPNAKKVLNRARQAVPTSAEVWLAAARLEEAAGGVSAPGVLLPRALKALAAAGVSLGRDWWLHEAQRLERASPPAPCTSEAVVRATAELGVEPEDRERTWLADAQESRRKGALACARALFEVLVDRSPSVPDYWLRFAEMEREVAGDEGIAPGVVTDDGRLGTSEALPSNGAADSRPAPGAPNAGPTPASAAPRRPSRLDAVLARAVKACPGSETLWLTAARARWEAGDPPGARRVLEEAFLRNPDSEDMWLAAAEIERRGEELTRARALLAKARAHEPASTPRVWLRSADLERQQGRLVEAQYLLLQARARFPKEWKVHAALAQTLESRGDLHGARSAYAAGLKSCPDADVLWIGAANLEAFETHAPPPHALPPPSGNVPRARALLEQARARRPSAPGLWLAAARIEGPGPAGDALMARALRACPDAGALWAEHVQRATRAQRRSRSVDALQRCGDHPLVVCAVARLFWAERKVDKARAWLARATALAPDLGDAWALRLRFERTLGVPEQAAAVEREAAVAKPRHGERWQRLAKDPERARKTLQENLEDLARSMDDGPAV